MDYVREVVLVLLVTLDFTELVRWMSGISRQKPLVDVWGGTEGCCDPGFSSIICLKCRWKPLGSGQEVVNYTGASRSPSTVTGLIREKFLTSERKQLGS